MGYNLYELKSCIDQAVKNAEAGGVDLEDVGVEVWHEPEDGPAVRYKIVRVGQFGIIPDITLDIEEYE